MPLARETYLDAWGAALFAGRLADAGGDLPDVSHAARAAPATSTAAAPSDLLLDGLATLVTDGRAAAAPTLRQAVRRSAASEVSVEEWLQWGVLASSAAVSLWDFESWDAVSSRQIELARGAGALDPAVDRPERAGDDRHLVRRVRGGGGAERRGRRGQGGDGDPHRAVRRDAARRLPGADGRGVAR